MVWWNFKQLLRQNGNEIRDLHQTQAWYMKVLQENIIFMLLFSIFLLSILDSHSAIKHINIFCIFDSKHDNNFAKTSRLSMFYISNTISIHHCTTSILKSMFNSHPFLSKLSKNMNLVDFMFKIIVLETSNYFSETLITFWRIGNKGFPPNASMILICMS